MSLILEALRKSEAERRRGLPPDVHAELPPAPAPRARARPAAWWAVAAVVALALGAWWMLRTPDLPAEAPAAGGTPEATSSAAAPAQAPALPAMTPAPPPAVPAPQSVPSVPAAPRDMASSDPLAAPTATAPPAAAADPRPAPHPIDPTAVPAPPAALPAQGRVLSLSELDPGARDALPPLRMSMHLWNEAPALRFAIIDGRRVAEGDSMGAVRIARIERDGVLLEWQGRQIHLPVR